MTRVRVLAASLVAGAMALAFGPAHAATNLIVNGDFTDGTNGFTTGYTYVPPGYNALFPEGLYTIATNPNSVHQYWVNIASTTPMLMLVNGATSGGPTVWEENISTPTTGTYKFSADVMDLCCNSTFPGTNAPSELQFWVSVNGGTWTELASYTSTTTDAGLQNLLTASFSSVAGENIDIKALNGSDAASGNDFALSNLSLTAVPEPATWAMLILGVAMIGFAARRRTEGTALAA